VRIARMLVLALAALVPAGSQAAAPARTRLAMVARKALSGLKVKVPATANPYLAGMPAGTDTSDGDKAPQESPVLVEISLADAVAVSFSASGGVENHPYDPPVYDPPDGSLGISHRAEHGISAIAAPIDSLVGVFLDDGRPDGSPAPPPLDFRAIGWDFASLSPQLKQIFFIGAGTTKVRVAGSGKKARVARRYLVPKGATRLFLGTLDEYEWNNNKGAFDVIVTPLAP